MSDVLSFAEVDGQRVELLPARTVLSLFTAGPAGPVDTSGAAGGGPAAPTYAAGAGGDGSGKAAFFNPIFHVYEGDVTNALTGGAGGAGGAVGGGAAPAGGAAGG